MSAINTNGLNVSYPVAGVNNSTQGFRDNFSVIKTNLDTASAEINDLQSKVVVKSALAGTNINNDMANTLISNALIRSFRASTYNLGNDISGVQIVNVSQGDVQYGTITADTTIQFGGWSPTGTQSNVQLILSIANANATLTLPNTTIGSENKPTLGMSLSARSLQNYSSNIPFSGIPANNIIYTNSLTVPYGVNQVHYVFSTKDCGSTVDIDEVNRSKIAGQVVTRTPTGIGQRGDKKGTVCVDSSHYYICTGDYDGSTVIWQTVTSAPIGTQVSSEVAFANTAGTVTASAQPSITSVGPLDSLAVVGNISAGNAALGNAVTANFFIGNGSRLTNIAAANVIGNIANANYASYAGNVVIATQGNITGVGTLTSLNVTGNVGIGSTNPLAKLMVVGTAFSPNQNLTDASSIVWDTSLGQVATFTFVLTNRTMTAPANLVNGGFYALAVYQNAGNNTLIWNSVFKWAAGIAPTLSTAAGAKDFFVFRSDGTNMYEQGRSLGVA